jgi:hypothetical protein
MLDLAVGDHRIGIRRAQRRRRLTERDQGPQGDLADEGIDVAHAGHRGLHRLRRPRAVQRVEGDRDDEGIAVSALLEEEHLGARHRGDQAAGARERLGVAEFVEERDHQRTQQRLDDRVEDLERVGPRRAAVDGVAHQDEARAIVSELEHAQHPAVGALAAEVELGVEQRRVVALADFLPRGHVAIRGLDLEPHEIVHGRPRLSDTGEPRTDARHRREHPQADVPVGDPRLLAQHRVAAARRDLAEDPRQHQTDRPQHPGIGQ